MKSECGKCVSVIQVSVIQVGVIQVRLAEVTTVRLQPPHSPMFLGMLYPVAHPHEMRSLSEYPLLVLRFTRQS